ncbi:MAG: NAD(P)H-quinone oxidoreductase subunit 4 [Synechococcales cyanobacterium K44_A2020_017]|jgi:NAD(P)H-quinone oxidoreductase subunit 4|uniref:NAD(P)H-quinone oxidoreductase subunit 4 n=1 Tax=Leptolyngbya sp. CCY15150 TaxID=2767772 RepID=UPI001950AB6E|nr:NAD(P)H-quinone oxidoreductase subunit 4 [Leptolyngbya sp. CCY15150]MBF2090208.1 NAD(P)H-quinone oxidoreductase subunit 4 [Synechococcales cyanobacterium K32_A2020_035]MBF2094469.1 NAD(P)H-quinone oxidoreductase subunit 4 [Synechococcales cyanobacterium K44_A2020_017]
MTTQFPWLTALILFPLIAALPIPIIPDQNGKTLRWYTLGVGLAEFALMLYTFWAHYDLHNPEYQLVESYTWVSQVGLNWSVAVDGLSMPLVILSGLVTTLAILASWNVTHKPRLYFVSLLVVFSAQIGVFVAQDMLMFFIMWELELVPVYLLIAIWGGKRRLYAATKFILYTAVGSLFILMAAFAMAFYGDVTSFDLQTLAAKDYSLPFELSLYAALLIAFGVKLPIFPFHTWLPDAHSEAPAPVSMILAGVLLKMAGYGLIRMNMEMLPNAHTYFAPFLAILGVISIIYASLTAFAQTNLKRRMAYSSIAHMGFVLIGIASFNTLGLSGAVLQMVSHGLIAATLFFLSGVAYDRTHTLAMDEMGGMAKQMPTVFALFTAGSLASLALPGMSGFVGELTVFLGFTTSDAYGVTFKAAIVLLAAVGVILSPIYLLSMLRQVFYGEESVKLADMKLFDIKPREAFIAACLLVPIIGIGVYPKLATQTYDVKTEAVMAQLRGNLPTVAEQPFQLQAPRFVAPPIFGAETKELATLSR